MFAAKDYLELARECLAAAEKTDDPERQKTLIEAAKQFMQTALNTPRAAKPAPEGARKRHRPI